MRMPLALALALPMVVAPGFAAPAQAQAFVDKQVLERFIEKTFKQQRSIRVDAKCPKQVTWVKKKTFTCKVTATNGDKGKVRVTLLSNATKGRLKVTLP
jgi:hypothetical protein